MQVISVNIPYKVSWGDFHLYIGGDNHLGIVHCAEQEIAQYVQTIKNDRFCRWIDIGDKGEFITPSDPRWDARVLAPWLDDPDNIGTLQERKYCQIYKPIASKCLGLVKGNHEDSIQKHSHINVHKNICDALGVTDLGSTAFLRLKFNKENSTHKQVFDVYVAHGAGWAITKGAKLNRLERIMDAFEADIYAFGHLHEIITDTKPYLMLNQDMKIKQKKKIGAITGCFFKTYMQDVGASYGERRNLPPVTIGAVVFSINPDKNEIDVHEV